MTNVWTNVAEPKVRKENYERVFSPRTESGRGINIPNGWCLCHKLVTQSKAKTPSVQRTSACPGLPRGGCHGGELFCPSCYQQGHTPQAMGAEVSASEEVKTLAWKGRGLQESEGCREDFHHYGRVVGDPRPGPARADPAPGPRPAHRRSRRGRGECG